MNCPACSATTRVLESRPAKGGSEVRRRRECEACGRRFTTFERLEREPLTIRKRDGSLEPFDRRKLAGGLLRASHKRPIEPEAIDALVDRIVAEAEAGGGEIAAERVGDLAITGLHELDRVAYLQFAVVYRGIDDPGELRAELEAMSAAERSSAEGQSRKVGTSSDPVSVRKPRNS